MVSSEARLDTQVRCQCTARVLMTNCISLLPGTLAARLDGDRVELHLLDESMDPEPELLRLEQAIAHTLVLSTEIDHV